jgi:Domain of unknown function (DUF5615)
VRVLLDEQLPRQLASELVDHDVTTVQRHGWSGMKNGDLLAAAAGDGFDVLVTADQNLQFQQNLSTASLGVVIIYAPSNALEDLSPLVPQIGRAISEVSRGEVRHVRS